MATFTFARSIQQHLSAPPCAKPGATLRAALEQVFANNPPLRSYLLDDQGSLRKHLAVFIDGTQIQDPVGLSDRVSDTSNVHVIQALSGG